MKRWLKPIVLLCLPFAVQAQHEDVDDDFRKFAQEVQEQFDAFSHEAARDFATFRDSANNEYARFVRQAWAEFESFAAPPLPKEKPVPPVVMPEEDRKNPLEDKPVVIEEVVKPAPPMPQPQPIVPIPEVKPRDNEEPVQPIVKPTPPAPKPKPTPPTPVEKEKPLRFLCYGTTLEVSLYRHNKFSLRAVDNNAIADAWQHLSSGHYNNLLRDCLSIRSAFNLGDWAYKNMLDSLAIAYFGRPCNEATLLKAYIYCQSGYKMRLATKEGRLMMLFASRHKIYDRSYYTLDGCSYYVDGEDPDRIHICPASYPNEQPLSLQIYGEQLFASNMSSLRTLRSNRNKDWVAHASVNKNMLTFYQDYPSSSIQDNFITRWAMYANAPIGDATKRILYPELHRMIGGKSAYDAVNTLCIWVQTAFVYEYDSIMWGCDRAFFPEESLHYPYCDCEDRSILLTRLVRDLLDLPCALVYYPGHLATAIAVGNDAKGDYFLSNGVRYLICDPTYIGAPIGNTMPGMNHTKAKVLILE